MNEKLWYGARTLYQIKTNTTADQRKLYEERVVVLKATSFDDAIFKAEQEALGYSGKTPGVKYLEFVNVFKLFDEKIKDKTEVFSLMRESGFASRKYIERYFDTGNERTQNVK